MSERPKCTLCGHPWEKHYVVYHQAAERGCLSILWNRAVGPAPCPCLGHSDARSAVTAPDPQATAGGGAE